MALNTRRVPLRPQQPYRTIRPSTSKIIFLSLEGSVTEEEYFKRIMNVFSDIKSKIQFISVAEDAVNTLDKFRTPEQRLMLSKTHPHQLLERIEQFKQEKKEVYQFDAYPDDEFWIVTDIDDNLTSERIEEWNTTLDKCDQSGYSYAVSNPFFEMWLLLHHDIPTEEDKKFAVTDEHDYEATSHFRERLRSLGFPLKDRKHIHAEHYTIENIYRAINQADRLHVKKDERYPKYFATTVYILLQKIIELMPSHILPDEDT